MKNTISAITAVTIRWLVTVKKYGNMPNRFADQDEHEQREHQREELHRLMARGVAHHVCDELVEHLAQQLRAARNDGAALWSPDQEQPDDADG